MNSQPSTSNSQFSNLTSQPPTLHPALMCPKLQNSKSSGLEPQPPILNTQPGFRCHALSYVSLDESIREVVTGRDSNCGRCIFTRRSATGSLSMYGSTVRTSPFLIFARLERFFSSVLAARFSFLICVGLGAVPRPPGAGQGRGFARRRRASDARHSASQPDLSGHAHCPPQAQKHSVQR